MADGIGEYMVAAPLLERKLTTGRHEPGAERCREGVAVVWAAIDWQRVGMTKPIEEELLRELYAHYLIGPGFTEEGFRRGLEWALEPLYASVALLRRAASFLPYDHIVAYADRQLGRPIDDKSWDRIIEVADRADSLDLGLLAYQRGDKGRAERATRRATDTEAPDPEIASRALFNLGVLLHERGDVEGARAAWREVIEFAGGGIGVVLAQRGDYPVIVHALRQRDDALGVYQLGSLLHARGDLEGAEAAYRRADQRGHAEAAFSLGSLLLTERGDLEGAEAAYRRADQRGHAEAALHLGALLHARGDLEGAEAAYRRADQRGHAGAAFNLGLLLERRGDLEGADAAYGRAEVADDSEVARRASAAIESLRRKPRS
jgi:tetratricopeptide (TPR) repeat protein